MNSSLSSSPMKSLLCVVFSLMCLLFMFSTASARAFNFRVFFPDDDMGYNPEREYMGGDISKRAPAGSGLCRLSFDAWGQCCISHSFSQCNCVGAEWEALRFCY